MAIPRPFECSELCKGVWKAKAGEGDFLQLLSFSGVSPRWEGLEKMPATAFPCQLAGLSFEELRDKLILRLPLDRKERLYGLGLNFKRLEIQQTVRHLQVDHFGGRDNGRNHAPVPLYFSSQGYGVFVNQACTISVYAGGVHRKDNHPPVFDRLDKEWQSVQPGNRVEIVVPGPATELIIFAGPSPLDVVRRFNLYCGGGTLPPRWGLGFWHRVPLAFTAEQSIAEVEAFEAHGFPLNVLGLEPGWHTQSYPTSYEWNLQRFPEPKAFVEHLLQKGVRVNLWENGYVAPDSPLGKDLAPYCGDYTGGWGGITPDLSLPEARAIMAEQHRRRHLDLGISGYKLDECDGFDRWIWPDHATFPSGLSGAEIRQVYGVLFQRMTQELFRSKNQRTYGLVRASNAGAVSLPYVIYNDHFDHRDFITALCSSSLCGLLWTPEVRSSPTAEEWLRRVQAVCFSPLAMIDAWADGCKPWIYPEVSEQVKEVMLLRMRLIPYIYTAFAQYQREGIPPVRAMILAEGFLNQASDEQQGELDATANPYSAPVENDVKDQFMLGPYLLVAPLFAGQKNRMVALPKGAWFDFYTGAFVASGPSEVNLDCSNQKIPLLVCDGGLIPLMPPLLRAPVAGEIVDLEVRHYGSKNCEYHLYDDDGVTFDCENGKCTWLTLRVEVDSQGRRKGHVKAPSQSTYCYEPQRIQFIFMGN